ncbi:MAG: serine hydrolase domain-containing protein [Pirellulales bacterium]
MKRPADAIRWRDITLRHLLQHRGGWDRDQSFDAMFQSVRFALKFHAQPPASPQVVIRAMLAEKLDFVPGERYAYSNFGYCLLGRVIERLSGRSYEQFVQDEVLRPLGIQTMKLGRTRLEDRAAGEVRYYQPGSSSSVFASELGQDVSRPYGSWYLEAMDAHGGWLASAEDLIRFASAFDDLDKCPILNRQSIEEMFQRPDGAAGYEADGSKKEIYYSLGWMNREVGGSRVNHWHTGSLDGTATILIRRHDGRNMVGLLNTRSSTASPHLGRELDQIMHVAADGLSRPTP